MSDHEITWTHDRWGVIGTVSCFAPVGSNCRLICPEDCEQWPCGHDLVDRGVCNAVEWFDAEDDAVPFYAGRSSAPVRDYPVRVYWDGDTWLWIYAEECAE